MIYSIGIYTNHIAVISARMPVSRAMEGNFLITLPHDVVSMPNYSFTSL